MILVYEPICGGVLMGEAVDRINSERRGGEISTDPFDGVGGVTGGFLGIAGGDRSKVVDLGI